MWFLVLGAHLWVKMEPDRRPSWLIAHFPRRKDVLVLADVDPEHSLSAHRLVARCPRRRVPRRLVEPMERIVGRPATVSHRTGGKQCTRCGG